MARARIKRDKTAADLSDIILAEWFRLLDPTEPTTPAGKAAAMARFVANADIDSLSAAFGKVLDNAVCEAVIDGDGSVAAPVKIIVPRPPRLGQKELYDYLDSNSDFRAGMGAAILFGCGR
jgi:hypothetical protein